MCSFSEGKWYNKLMEKALGVEKNLSAKELTAAINTATEFVSNESSMGVDLAGEQVSDREGSRSGAVESLRSQAEAMRGLGRAAQLGEQQFSEQQVIASNNEVKRIVAAENGYSDSSNLNPGENVIGGESALEVKERLDSDEETAKIESGVGLPKDQLWMHEIAARSGKKLAEQAQSSVDEITSNNEFNPNMLEKLRFKLMLESARSNEGYSFGERN